MTDRIFIADDISFSDCLPGTAKVISSNNLEIAAQVLSDRTFRRVMSGFDVHLADGRGFQIVYWLATGRWPPKNSGSDIYRDLIELSVCSGKRVLLFGGSERANYKAIENLKAQYGDHFVGVSPPYGASLRYSAAILINCLSELDIGVCLVCFGAPRQEYLAHLARRFCGKKIVYLCAGGTVDFIAGEVARAPKWVQFSGLEWLFRAMQEPRRRIPRIFKALRLLVRCYRRFLLCYA